MGSVSTKELNSEQSTQANLELATLAEKYNIVIDSLEQEKIKYTQLSENFISIKTQLASETQNAQTWRRLYDSATREMSNSTALKQLTDQIQTLTDENFKLTKRLELIGTEFKRPVILWLSTLSQEYGEPSLAITETTALSAAVRTNILKALSRVAILDSVGEIGRSAEAILPAALFDRLINDTDAELFLKYLPVFFRPSD